MQPADSLFDRGQPLGQGRQLRRSPPPRAPAPTRALRSAARRPPARAPRGRRPRAGAAPAARCARPAPSRPGGTPAAGARVAAIGVDGRSRRRPPRAAPRPPRRRLDGFLFLGAPGPRARRSSPIASIWTVSAGPRAPGRRRLRHGPEARGRRTETAPRRRRRGPSSVVSNGASSATGGTSDSGREARGIGIAGCDSRFSSEFFQLWRSSWRACSSEACAAPASSARRPWRRRSRSTNVSFEISLKVSVTPRPAEATASTKG